VDKVDTPHREQKEVIWDGLRFIDFAFMPHWDSDHPESADIEKESAHWKRNNIPYKAIRDGEVIIIRNQSTCRQGLGCAELGELELAERLEIVPVNHTSGRRAKESGNRTILRYEPLSGYFRSL